MKTDIAIIESDSVVNSMMRANSALAGAVTVSQTKKIMDVAHAAEIYARRQKLSDEAVNQATSVKVEAMRKLGEILQAAPKAKGNAGPGRGKAGNKTGPAFNDAPTLDELGLTKRESAVAQKLASLPEKAFEQVRNGSLSIAKAIAAVDASKPATAAATAKTALTVVAPPEEDGAPDAAELESVRIAEAAATRTMNLLLASDTPLSDLAEKNTQLEAQIGQLNLRIAGLMNQNRELIQTIKRLQFQFKKQAAA